MGDVSNLVMSWRSVMMAMVCLPILICAFILLFRKTESAASKYLAVFLIIAALTMGPQIIGYAGFYDVWPGLTYFPLFYGELWLGPLLYLHADRLMRAGPLGWRKYLLLPGLVQTFYYLWAFFALGDFEAKWAYNKAVHHPYIMPVESVIGIALFVFALIAIWRLIGRYKTYLENTSSAALDYDPVWLRNLVIALVLGALIFAGLEIADITIGMSYDAAFPFQVLAMAVIAWFGIDAVWRLGQSFPKIAAAVSGDTAPVRKSPADDRDWTAEAARLRQRVISEQWFLESRLSIRDIAARMGSNETYISRTLNQGLGQSFNHFINALRVEHAKALIRETDSSLLTIALDSGFNSKATFNRVFRNLAGMTPSQFKANESTPSI